MPRRQTPHIKQYKGGPFPSQIGRCVAAERGAQNAEPYQPTCLGVGSQSGGAQFPKKTKQFIQVKGPSLGMGMVGHTLCFALLCFALLFFSFFACAPPPPPPLIFTLT